MVLRDLDTSQRHRILRHLEPDQAQFTKAAFEECRARSQDFPEILGVPPAGGAFSPISPQEILLPFPDFEEEEPVPCPEVSLAPKAGHPVFRVGRTKAAAYGVLGAVVFGGVGVLLSAALEDPVFMSALVAIGLVAGVLLGVWRRFDVCSDSECGAVIPAQVVECPGCGGSIRGRVASKRDHIPAVERLEGRTQWPEDAEPPY